MLLILPKTEAQLKHWEQYLTPLATGSPDMPVPNWAVSIDTLWGSVDLDQDVKIGRDDAGGMVWLATKSSHTPLSPEQAISMATALIHSALHLADSQTPPAHTEASEWWNRTTYLALALENAMAKMHGDSAQVRQVRAAVGALNQHIADALGHRLEDGAE